LDLSNPDCGATPYHDLFAQSTVDTGIYTGEPSIAIADYPEDSD